MKVLQTIFECASRGIPRNANNVAGCTIDAASTVTDSLAQAARSWPEEPGGLAARASVAPATLSPTAPNAAAPTERERAQQHTDRHLLSSRCSCRAATAAAVAATIRSCAPGDWADARCGAVTARRRQSAATPGLAASARSTVSAGVVMATAAAGCAAR